MLNRKSYSVTDDDGELVDVVRTFSAEVRVLRMAVDELREEIQWANRNRGIEPHDSLSPGQQWSVSFDQAAQDFTEDLSRESPDCVTSPRAIAAAPAAASGPSQQQQLW